MPLVAAAVCPHPPLIVSDLAGRAAPELDPLRDACATAIDRLLATRPDFVVLVGGGDRTRRHDPADRGSLTGYGLDHYVHLSRINCAGTDNLPLSLVIGAWLMHRSGNPGLVMGQSIAPDESPASCREIGTDWVTGADSRIAVLAMGDGSACRGEKAPGHHDPRARPYDDRVAAALAGADRQALLDLDPDLSARLRVAGRGPWQVLAGATSAAGGDWRGELSYHEAPYGVGYFVANWEPA